MSRRGTGEVERPGIPSVSPIEVGNTDVAENDGIRSRIGLSLTACVLGRASSSVFDRAAHGDQSAAVLDPAAHHLQLTVAQLRPVGIEGDDDIVLIERIEV